MQVTRTFLEPMFPAVSPSRPSGPAIKVPAAAPITAFPTPNPFLWPEREVEPHFGQRAALFSSISCNSSCRRCNSSCWLCICRCMAFLCSSNSSAVRLWPDTVGAPLLLVRSHTSYACRSLLVFSLASLIAFEIQDCFFCSGLSRSKQYPQEQIVSFASCLQFGHFIEPPPCFSL